jgi:hypothetical protein
MPRKPRSTSKHPIMPSSTRYRMRGTLRKQPQRKGHR